MASPAGDGVDPDSVDVRVGTCLSIENAARTGVWGDTFVRISSGLRRYQGANDPGARWGRRRSAVCESSHAAGALIYYGDGHTEALGGISRVTFQMDSAELTHEQLLRSYELFGTQVAPLVRGS